MLNRSGEKQHLCVPDLRENAFSFFQLSIVLAVGFWVNSFYEIEEFPSSPSWLRVFF